MHKTHQETNLTVQRLHSGAHFGPRARRAFPMPSSSIRPAPSQTSMTAFQPPRAPQTLLPYFSPFPSAAWHHGTLSKESVEARDRQPAPLPAPSDRTPRQIRSACPAILSSFLPSRAHRSAPPGTPAEPPAPRPSRPGPHVPSSGPGGPYAALPRRRAPLRASQPMGARLARDRYVTEGAARPLRQWGRSVALGPALPWRWEVAVPASAARRSAASAP